MSDRPTFSFKVDDKPYVLDYGKLTGRDLMDFQSVVGMPLTVAASGGTEPLIMVAAIKWLFDRRSNDKLAFGDVLDTITYDDVSFEEAEVPPDPPTQEGGSDKASRPSLTSTGSDLGKLTA
jgi:hypothetical protein